MAAGLQKVLKIYGRMRVGDGKNNLWWRWDYAQDKPRLEKDMTKEEIAASDKAKYQMLKDPE